MGTPSRIRHGAVKARPTSPIPDKLYFRIGEVSQLVGVEAHVLRYWEKEVPAIRPGKSVSNQRRYRRRDVELFREIRRLLYEEKYTLAGARKRLMSGDRADSTPHAAPDRETEADDEFTVDFASDPELRELQDVSGVVPETAERAAEPRYQPVSSSADRSASPSRAIDPQRLQRLRTGLQELIIMTGE